MTFKVVKFFTSETAEQGCYEVAMCGDGRYFHKLQVRTNANLGPDALDYVELYGIWFFIIAIEFAGMARTAKGFSLVVSRGAIKKLLRTDSSKAHLFSYTNSIRTQLYGLENITVEKAKDWADQVEPNICSYWDGLPPEQPEVNNPIVGRVGISFHSVQRYFEHTRKEGRMDQVFAKVTRLLRDAVEEVHLDARTMQHKVRAYGASAVEARYLNTAAGWQLVILKGEKGKRFLATVYQRQNGY